MYSIMVEEKGKCEERRVPLPYEEKGKCAAFL